MFQEYGSCISQLIWLLIYINVVWLPKLLLSKLCHSRDWLTANFCSNLLCVNLSFLQLLHKYMYNAWLAQWVVICEIMYWKPITCTRWMIILLRLVHASSFKCRVNKITFLLYSMQWLLIMCQNTMIKKIDCNAAWKQFCRFM